MKKLIVLFTFILSGTVSAAGYTAWAKPQMLEYVNGGILVNGAFGDVNNCGQADYIFIAPSADPVDFSTMTSIILTAFAAQKEVRFYTSSCAAVTFHYTGTPINAAHNHGFYIR